jgi:dolichol-phosphate mannosyltransferase
MHRRFRRPTERIRGRLGARPAPDRFPNPSKVVNYSTVTRTVVVIPTYNEADNLPRLVPEVLAQDPGIQVAFVDDASPDGTGKLADDLAVRNPGRVHVLHREGRRGLGPAYRDGLRHALELGADVVVQMDADFSHPPASLPLMFARIEAGADVVLGSRYLKGITVVNWPIERILISWFGNWYARKVTGLSISDTTGGFRCIRRELLEKIGFERIRANGYAFQIEMNYRFQKHGARIQELPFFFLDRTRGTSKLSLRIAVEALWIVWWLRLADRLGRL